MKVISNPGPPPAPFPSLLEQNGSVSAWNLPSQQSYRTDFRTAVTQRPREPPERPEKHYRGRPRHPETSRNVPRHPHNTPPSSYQLSETQDTSPLPQGAVPTCSGTCTDLARSCATQPTPVTYSATLRTAVSCYGTCHQPHNSSCFTGLKRTQIKVVPS